MSNLISKSDFIGVVPFSVNIPSINVDVHCNDAQIMDTYPIMPVAMVSGNNLLDDLSAALNESPVTKPELIAFFNDYIKPFMVCSATCRFLLYHGRNITQFGIRVNNEETSNDIGDKGRAEMIKDIEHKQNVYLARMKARLKAVNYTFDTVVYKYQCDNKPKARTQIYSI